MSSFACVREQDIGEPSNAPGKRTRQAEAQATRRHPAQRPVRPRRCGRTSRPPRPAAIHCPVCRPAPAASPARATGPAFLDWRNRQPQHKDQMFRSPRPGSNECIKMISHSSCNLVSSTQYSVSAQGSGFGRSPSFACKARHIRSETMTYWCGKVSAAAGPSPVHGSSAALVGYKNCDFRSKTLAMYTHVRTYMHSCVAQTLAKLLPIIFIHPPGQT